MQNLTVGHQDDVSIAYLDQNGNPMLTPVTPDSPPTWTHAPSASGVDVLTESADGTTAQIEATAPGTDTVTLTVVVGGKTYQATEQLNIQAAPQVLSSVQIQNNIQ